MISEKSILAISESSGIQPERPIKYPGFRTEIRLSFDTILKNIQQSIIQQADRCVKCGLCLPHCPTYGLSQSESESPRGRIALIQGLAAGLISNTEGLRQHLDHCLLCRRCEQVCPSGVEYGQIMDQAREWQAQEKPAHGMLGRWGMAVLAHQRQRRILACMLWLYQRSGLAFILRLLGVLHLFGLQHAARLLPRLSWPTPMAESYPSTGQTVGRVALFTGCLAELEQTTILSAIKLLNRLGYEVVIPARQRCCGGLHQHSGEAEQARALASTNLAAFADVDQVLYFATGCGSFLTEYEQLDWNNDQQRQTAASLVKRLSDITAFINGHADKLPPLQPLSARVAIHTPCSAQSARASLDLLSKIPGLESVQLPQQGCCGAAGSFMLSQPKLASQIRQATIDTITTTAATLIVTSNPACAIHIKDGLPASAKILHPVTLLAQQLADAPDCQ